LEIIRKSLQEKKPPGGLKQLAKLKSVITKTSIGGITL